MSQTELTNRILAIVLALCVWAYVRVSQDSPNTTRTIRDVPVRVMTATGWGYLLHQNTVTVTVRGPAERVNSILRSELDARINLSTVQSRIVNAGRAIDVTLPDGTRLSQPVMVKVTTYKLETRTFTITPAFITIPPPGTTIGEYEITPREIAVVGSPAAISQVRFVHVLIDPTVRMSSARDLIPHPVNADGERVSDVVMTVSTVKVRMLSLTGQPTTRRVAVGEPALINLPRGYIVRVSAIRPKEVTVSGEPSALERLPAFLDTDPIDVNNVRRDTTRTIRLRLPRDVQVVEGQTVRVDLEAHPANQ